MSAERPKGWWRQPLGWRVTVHRGVPRPKDVAEASRRRARSERRHARGTNWPMPHLVISRRKNPKRQRKPNWTMSWTTHAGEHVTVHNGRVRVG